MSEKPKYTQEEALAEADLLKDQIDRSMALDYKEAERLVESGRRYGPELNDDFRSGFSAGWSSHAHPKYSHFDDSMAENKSYMHGWQVGRRAAVGGFPEDPEFKPDLTQPTTLGEVNMILFRALGPFAEGNLAELTSEYIEGKIGDIEDAAKKEIESGKIDADEEGFRTLNTNPEEALKCAEALRRYLEYRKAKKY